MEQEIINHSSANSTYQFRCQPEEKKFLQEEILKSGLPPAKFIKTAVEAFAIQGECEGSEAKKALLEVDSLTSRLNGLIRAQLVQAIELQVQSKKDIEAHKVERIELEEHKKSIEEKLTGEFEQKAKVMEEEFYQSLAEKEGNWKTEFARKEKEMISLLEKVEALEVKCRGLERDYSAVKQQHTDSLRMFEVTDDRLMETKKKLMELEGKFKLHEETLKENQELKLRYAVQEAQMDALRKEHSLKLEHLEKEIRLEMRVEKTNVPVKQFYE
ncbi:hypothetical protein [Fluviispira sanaruensis]|uniref:Uncharacterized protein n=1 Tax=Fluviispira sanaruensis TaxID=2493639 RepID=A0A4P2VYG3_FLUSA|nr:hypothetical protein [Fluviispira sanaruensis]BBH54745.1 hypothetical protein JCM31447_32190 [Fluviispira sanaruensis]